MKRLFVVIGIVLSAAAAGPAAATPPLDSVRIWNDLALDTVRVKRASDADAARTYAMVNVAMFDATNGIVSWLIFAREPALVPPDGAPRFADLSAAASTAAYTVLVALYPDQSARFAAQLAADLQALAGRPGVGAGQTWGANVGARVVAARAQDGSSPVETQAAGSGPGVFRAAWSGTQYRNLAPFGIENPDDYVSDAPPALDSLAYAAGLAEVKLLGSQAIPSDANLATFQYWALSAGTVQPPGEWVKIALELSQARGLSLLESSRLLTLVSISVADVVAPTVMTKFLYQHWRPATAIQEADTDGNPYTDADPSWKPRAGGIGSSPQHTSGHSTFSGAAGEALALYFCRDDISFTHVSDSSGGVARTYTSFSAAAREAGRSRVLGGIHFEFSNQAGLDAGRGVAREVSSKKLLHRFGPTHLGACPL